MGKGNKPKPPEVNYNAALVEARKPSPQEEALSKASLKTLDWADKGDFRDPRGGGLFVNYADPAMLHRNRELQSNAGGQGIFALGTPDPNYLATVRENQLAENQMMDAAQYEKDIQEGVARAAGVAGDTARMDQARRMGVLGTTAGIYSQEQNKKRWWEYVLEGVSTAAQGSVASAV